jgi:hypothetical protein
MVGVGEIDLKPIVSSVSGRKVSEFGTVRPRVQIPGPRPSLWVQILVAEREFGSNSRASRFCAVRGDGVLISKPVAHCSTSCSNPEDGNRISFELSNEIPHRQLAIDT